MSINGTLVEYKMRRFKGESAQFSFNKVPIYTHDGASAKFSTNSQEMDNSAGILQAKTIITTMHCYTVYLQIEYTMCT